MYEKYLCIIIFSYWFRLVLSTNPTCQSRQYQKKSQQLIILNIVFYLNSILKNHEIKTSLYCLFFIIIFELYLLIEHNYFQFYKAIIISCYSLKKLYCLISFLHNQLYFLQCPQQVYPFSKWPQVKLIARVFIFFK